MISGTLYAWANALGKDSKTLSRELSKVGINAEREITAQEIFKAVLNEEQVERNRNLKLDADRKEREEKEANGQLVQMAEVEKLISEKVVLPLRARLLSAPTTLDTLCNPSDPELARQAILHWVDETLKLLRDGLQ